MMELNNQGIEYNFIFTGQHKATIDKLLKNFSLKNPDYILDKGEKDITGIVQMFFWLFKCLFMTIKNKEEIFRTRFNKYPQKNMILVHGDTISALLDALIGKLLRYKVGHIESGLRSFNYFHPFLEEIIRVLTFKLSDIY